MEATERSMKWACLYVLEPDVRKQYPQVANKIDKLVGRPSGEFAAYIDQDDPDDHGISSVENCFFESRHI